MSRSRRKSKKRRLHRQPRIQRLSPPGAAPATLVAHQDAAQTVATVIRFSDSEYNEEAVNDLSKIEASTDPNKVTWIQIRGFRDVQSLEQLAEKFDLHGLAMEDALSSHQRSKIERYDDHLFVVLHMVDAASTANGGHLESNQLSLFLGPGFVLTFQESDRDCLDPVRNRLKSERARLRIRGADFLAYSVVDTVIDSYFPVVDHFAERLEQLDREIATANPENLVDEIHCMRADLMMMRRIIHPLRDSLALTIPDPHALIRGDTQFYFRDCFDHTIQLIELLDTYRETCSSLRDYYMASMDHRMNEVMKLLTIVATIFIPLGFITGLYGMNFNTHLPGNMPELEMPYGYLLALGLMAVVAVGQVWFIWRKGWFDI